MRMTPTKEYSIRADDAGPGTAVCSGILYAISLILKYTIFVKNSIVDVFKDSITNLKFLDYREFT